jgi:hypothetical protein
MSQLNISKFASPLYYDNSHSDQHQESQSYLVVNRASYSPAGVLNVNGNVLTFQVPALDMFSQMVLQLGGFAATAANQTVSVGWGFNAIDNIKLQIGNSDVLTVSGAQIFHNVMSDCETQDKKVHILRNAGLANDLTQDAIIPLSLLWSRFIASKVKKPFPAYMVGSGLNLQIQLKQFMEGSAGSSYVGTFSTCRLLMRHIVDKSGGVILKGGQVYHYPCSIGSFIKQNVTGATAPSNRVSINLQSFYAGRLRNIKLLAVDTTDATTNKYTKATRLQNIRLLQAGQVIYDFPSISSDAFETAVLFDNNTFVTDSTVRYIYNLNLAALDNTNPNMSHNGINLSNQFLTLEFTTAAANNYDVYIMYEYSGSLIVADKSVMISYVN